MDTTNPGHEPVSMSRFGPFALDMSRAQLTCSGVPVALRPKTLALLSYFTAHPGRVVSKDELLAAVWPGVVVTDDSLSQCVRELRTALGDDGQGLIKTIARRGYLFEPAPQAPTADAALAARRNRRWVWVGLALACALLLGSLTLAWQREQAPVSVDQGLKARRSIAVMPFTELGAGGREYFAEAITEDLITDLAKLPDTLVIARTSAAAVAARETDSRKIGRELGVRHVLSGSVRRDGAAVQINAQFAASDNGAVLWSGRFDYPDVADWAWKRDIGTRIARVLDVRMTTAAAVQAAAHNGKRLDAIDATLQGQHLLRHVVSLADLLRAREHFERALAIEPDSASALTGLAQSQLSEFEAGWNIGVQGIALAEKTIARALAADPDYLPAQCLMGHVLRERGDFEGALRVYQKVVAANPSDAWSHARIGVMKLRLGRLEEVAVHTDAALRLSPFEAALVGYSHLYAGDAEYYLGREDAAYERMRQSAAAGPSPTQVGAFLRMASIDALHGRGQEARQHAAQALRLLRPRWTIGAYRVWTAPVHPRLQAGRERFFEGLRKAGLPE